MVSGCKFLLSEPLEYQAFAFRSMFRDFSASLRDSI
jgi:hypothetical protein